MLAEMRARISVVSAVLAAVFAILSATSVAASGPRLSITAVGAPMISIAGLHLQEAATDTPLTIDAKLSGAVPAGAKVKLAVRTVASAPFKAQKGTIAFHGGRASFHVNASIASTVSYRAVAVSASGATLAKSASVGVFWVAPPTELVVTDDGDQADLNLKTGAITCYPQSSASGTTCTDPGGSSSGGDEPLGAYVNPTDMPPGASIALSFNGTQICTSSVFDGTCEEQNVTMPTVAATTTFPAVAQYTSPSGAKTTVTLQITDFP